jgi:hypothetical protein
MHYVSFLIAKVMAYFKQASQKTMKERTQVSSSDRYIAALCEADNKKMTGTSDLCGKDLRGSFHWKRIV